MSRESGATVTRGTDGYWWSQGANSNTYARNLAIYGNYTAPEGNYYKTYGFSVRCVGSTRVNDILHQFPFSLPYSGDVARNSGATVGQGTHGRWWSQGTNSNTTARGLVLGGNYTDPEGNDYKTSGFTVRCVISTRVNDILHQFPFSLPYSGVVSRGSGATVYQGTDGDWWSQGANSGTNAWRLGISGNYTSPEDNTYKTYGFSVRYVGSTRVNDILHQFPFSLPYSGAVDRVSGATVRQDTAGRWWSQGANSTTHARRLAIDGNYTTPEDTNYKTLGLPVRCVAQLFRRPKLHPRQ